MPSMCIERGHLRPWQGGMLLECLNGTVDRACAFGERNTLRPALRVCVSWFTARSEARLPRSTKTVPANSFNFPKGTLRLALLRKTMGQGLVRTR